MRSRGALQRAIRCRLALAIAALLLLLLPQTRASLESVSEHVSEAADLLEDSAQAAAGAGADPAEAAAEASCVDHAPGAPPNWLFIAATGRSGSTSLLEMVNQLPGVYLEGENMGLFESLFTLKEDATKDLQEFHEDEIRARVHKGVGSFYRAPGYVSPTASLDAIAREFVEVYVLGAKGSAFRAREEKARLVGFKEIRFKNAQELDYLIHLFPCAKVIINVRRDVVKQSASAEWQEGASALQQRNDWYTDWHQRNAQRSFLIALEDFTVPNMNKLAAWLGFPSCRFVRIAHSNAHGGYYADSTKDVNCAADR